MFEGSQCLLFISRKCCRWCAAVPGGSAGRCELTWRLETGRSAGMGRVLLQQDSNMDHKAGGGQVSMQRSDSGFYNNFLFAFQCRLFGIFCTTGFVQPCDCVLSRIYVGGFLLFFYGMVMV